MGMKKMDHSEAIQQMIAERYLLDELTLDAREAFEEHLFDCPECALDLRAGAAFVEAAKAQLPKLAGAAPVPSLPRSRKLQVRVTRYGGSGGSVGCSRPLPFPLSHLAAGSRLPESGHLSRIAGGRPPATPSSLGSAARSYAGRRSPGHHRRPPARSCASGRSSRAVQPGRLRLLQPRPL
jgi:anti-sigma factor RsiW